MLYVSRLSAGNYTCNNGFKIRKENNKWNVYNSRNEIVYTGSTKSNCEYWLSNHMRGRKGF